MGTECVSNLQVEYLRLVPKYLSLAVKYLSSRISHRGGYWVKLIVSLNELVDADSKKKKYLSSRISQ
jgi:hypothetical protein